MNFSGGCLCGALRYRSTAGPLTTGFCHCRNCQRSSGAPVSVWAAFPIDCFEYERGTPKIHKASERGRREFCESCGTHIAYRRIQGPEEVDVNVGTLDDPAAVQPEIHIWTRDRIAWFETRDDLPRHEDGGN